MTAVPALLERLDIRGCVVTTDALNTQKNIAAQIVAQGGDYVLALKGNHGLLYEDVKEFFDWLSQRPGGWRELCEDSSHTQEWQHGRHEVRRCFCLVPASRTGPRHGGSGQTCTAWCAWKASAASWFTIQRFPSMLKPRCNANDVSI